jgi:hypothetical protein
MDNEDHGRPIWRAGEVVAAGTYYRVDNRSYRVVVLEQEGTLPASCDGHVAWYCRATVIERSHESGVVFQVVSGQQEEASL